MNPHTYTHTHTFHYLTTLSSWLTYFCIECKYVSNLKLLSSAASSKPHTFLCPKIRVYLSGLLNIGWLALEVNLFVYFNSGGGIKSENFHFENRGRKPISQCVTCASQYLLPDLMFTTDFLFSESRLEHSPWN